ncbi:hypothetical protein ACIBKY_38290 [Nonomuraea sp. NPDC050394]|uniref:hypothetical protein n=1 Tax=Nonomuraea sp. NPDC050394 TaxID=3364363 RepID=UPI0037B23615
MRGWQVPAYPLPADRQDTIIQRILIRHGIGIGIGIDEISLLATDIRHALHRLTAGTPAELPADVARIPFHH